MPDLKEAADKLAEALEHLTWAEQTYRRAHDLHGDGHIVAGRAWDQLRRCGDDARAALDEYRRQK